MLADEHDHVVTVVAGRGDQASQRWRRTNLTRGRIAPDRFAGEKLPDRQGDDHAGVGFEHLPRAAALGGLRGRGAKVDDRRAGKERRAGGLLAQALPIIIQAVEPGRGGVFFRVRWWWANKATMVSAVK